MRRSLFKKYLIFGIVILLTSFIALIVTMYIFVIRYWEEEKKVSLIDNAKRVADVIESSSTYLPAAHMLIIDRESPVGLTVVNMSEIIDADIIVVDNTGKIAYCSAEDADTFASDQLPSYVLGATAQGDFFEAGTLEGYFPKARYTAGVPISMDTDDGEMILAFCYASTPATFDHDSRGS